MLNHALSVCVYFPVTSAGSAFCPMHVFEQAFEGFYELCHAEIIFFYASAPATAMTEGIIFTDCPPVGPARPVLVSADISGNS